MSQLRQVTYPDTQPTSRKPSMWPAIFAARWLLPLVALATIPFCFFCLATSLSDLRTYPGVDLRPKVVGARLLAAGLDPYDSHVDVLLSDYYRTNNRITFTPALLLLYVPLSSLPFATQRVIYYGLDWLFAAGVFYLLQRHFCQTRLQMYLCWIVYAAFVVCSYSFRLHLERGGYYTFLLLLTCHAAAAIKNKRTTWMSCIPTGLLLLLRPTYALMLLAALICLAARKWALRVTVVASLMFVLTLQFGGIQRWFGFMRVVREQQAASLAAANGDISGSARGSQEQTYPRMIESIDFQKMLTSNSWNGTFIGLCSAPIVRSHEGHLSKWIGPINSVFMLLVLAGGLAVAFIARRRIVNQNILILFMVLWPLIFEIFSPQRYFYTSVLEALPLLLLLLDLVKFKRKLIYLPRPYILTAVLVLGLLPPVAFQLMYKLWLLKGRALFTSAFILVVFPICLAAFCIYLISVSRKRTEQSLSPFAERAPLPGH